MQVREPLTAEIAVGTGSELVRSPIPALVEEHLYHGSWEAAFRELARLLTIPEVSAETLGDRCDLDVHRRAFYDKYIDADGIAIIGPSERTSRLGVADEFLYAVREIILTMTSEMPALREVLSLEHAFGFRYVLIGADWSMDVNMPRELRLHANYAGFFTGIGRGVMAAGGIYYHSYLTPPTPALHTNTVAHEMAHAIDDAFDWHPHLFPDWGTRLKTAYTLAYQNALQGKGFFNHPDDYALTNEMEYWAMGAYEWFTDIHGDDLHDEVQRARLIEQDPLLYALLDEVFPAVDFPTQIWIAEQ